MDYYFDYLPDELNVEILNYIDSYEDFINLNTLDNFQKVFNTKTFWKDLFTNSIGDSLNYININFKNVNIYYLSSSYVNAINCYKITNLILENSVGYVNTEINKLYPGKKIELLNKGTNFVISNLDIQKLSFLFGKRFITSDDELKLGLLIAENFITFRLSMIIGFLGYSIKINVKKHNSLFIQSLTKQEFFNILFNFIYNGEDYEVI